jgi:hypothetical protein
MGKYVADSVYIASIWPGKLNPIQKMVGAEPDDSKGRCTTYQLAPVPRRAKACVIEVTDGFETCRDWIQSAEQGREINNLRPVDCKQIAANLVAEWAGGFVDSPHGAGLGIRIISGSVPHEDELREMHNELSAFCEWSFQEAERHARLNEWREITATMRECAKWLGRDRLWSEPQKSGDLVPCAACQTPISNKALVCPQCGTKLKALTPELAKLEEATT